MGWQERDYAREPAQSFRASFGHGTGRGVWGGSIVKKLLIANIAIYVLCYMTALGPSIKGTDPTLARVRTPGGGVGYVEIEKGRPGYCEMITTKVLHGQVWRLVTSQYLHAGQMHLIFNMIGLYFLGQALQRVWGNKKFFVIYTIAGICGNLALMLAGIIGWIDPTMPAVGASGCILGLLGAAAVLFPHAEVLVYFLFPIKIRTAAIIFAGMYAYNVYARGHNFGGDLCHIAGLAFGAWWAWKGERWWATRRLASGAPQSSPADPGLWSGVGKGAWGRKIERHAADEQAMDRILAKVREGGIATLTEQEKRTLLAATERMRQEDARCGRTDRL